MPEQPDRIKESYEALETDQEQMNFLFKRMESARENLGKGIEQSKINADMHVFLENLTKDVKSEWIDTKDYQALKRKILGYDADIPWWDEKHLLQVPKDDFIKVSVILAERRNDRVEDDDLLGLSETEIKSDIMKRMKELGFDESTKSTIEKLMFKVGPIDSAQFVEWLYTTQDGEQFLNGPFETLEDFLVWKLIKEHGGNYTMPKDVKDESWLY